ncbi:MAG: hypothetical protein Q8M88_07240 [Phenylobacterium sp.]|uniref:hypothetical protein n=1 Tax=Phenylobacterium sp. TaxID=1871053 RepID=UPI002732B0A9|nr:hypothetical protein [Phenylobacterium sp.]MDP3174212.1 hypothetical protein [Phenylobacterium sp.]
MTMLAWRFGLFLVAAGRAVAYPGGIDYSEGVIWQQMRMICQGRAYGPIDGFPAVVFEYPPLYHLIVAAAARLAGADELATGRAVSVVATIVMGGLTGLATGMLTPGSRFGPKLTCGLAAGLIVFSIWPIAAWSHLMRVDMVAHAFSLGGLCLAFAAVTRPRLIHWAALCFVAALYTKQTAVAAPAAVFSVLLVLRPRLRPGWPRNRGDRRRNHPRGPRKRHARRCDSPFVSVQYQ